MKKDYSWLCECCRQKAEEREAEKTREYSRVYYDKNRDNLVEKKREKYREDPEPSRKSKKSYYERNRERILAEQKKKRRKLAEYMVEYRKKVKQRGPKVKTVRPAYVKKIKEFEVWFDQFGKPKKLITVKASTFENALEKLAKNPAVGIVHDEDGWFYMGNPLRDKA